MDHIITDVLIVGGGGAACRAAIAASDAGADVFMATKKMPGKGGATTFPVAEMAGYNAADPSTQGDIEGHYQDIVNAGKGMADEKLARILAEEAPATIKTLESWGLEFEKEDGRYYIFQSCFSSAARTHVIRGHGEPIVAVMKRQIAGRSSIKVASGITVIELIMKDGVCSGAWGIDEEGKLCQISAGAVVLATGGAVQAFQRNLNPRDVSGDGYLLGYQAGAELVNMEFMQAGVGFSHPVFNIFNGYIWAAYPSLSNKTGEKFLQNYIPESMTESHVMKAHRHHFPFSSSDDSKYIEISIQKEILAGHAGEHGGIYADLRHMKPSFVNEIPDDCGIHHMWPVAMDHMKERGVDLLKERVEISVFAQAINGGIRIDERGASNIPGLYAAGESAGGPHGADRLGGNMMVTCQVFGKRAGEYAAKWALAQKSRIQPGLFREPHIWELLHRLADTESGIRCLQKVNQENLLVCRNEQGLKKVLDYAEEELKQLQELPIGDQVNGRMYSLYSLLMSTKMMASAALYRRESRGSHYREDYPDMDGQKAVATVQRKSDIKEVKGFHL